MFSIQLELEGRMPRGQAVSILFVDFQIVANFGSVLTRKNLRVSLFNEN